MILQKEPVKMADIFEEVRLNLADWMAENKIRLKIHATGQGVMADREKNYRGSSLIWYQMLLSFRRQIVSLSYLLLVAVAVWR